MNTPHSGSTGADTKELDEARRSGRWSIIVAVVSTLLFFLGPVSLYFSYRSYSWARKGQGATPPLAIIGGVWSLLMMTMWGWALSAAAEENENDKREIAALDEQIAAGVKAAELTVATGCKMALRTLKDDHHDGLGNMFRSDFSCDSAQVEKDEPYVTLRPVSFNTSEGATQTVRACYRKADASWTLVHFRPVETSCTEKKPSATASVAKASAGHLFKPDGTIDVAEIKSRLEAKKYKLRDAFFDGDGDIALFELTAKLSGDYEAQITVQQFRTPLFAATSTDVVAIALTGWEDGVDLSKYEKLLEAIAAVEDKKSAQLNKAIEALDWKITESYIDTDNGYYDASLDLKQKEDFIRIDIVDMKDLVESGEARMFDKGLAMAVVFEWDEVQRGKGKELLKLLTE